MKVVNIAATLISCLAIVSSTAVPKSVEISIRDESALAEIAWVAPLRGLLPRAIEKRKGGGGGGGRGGTSSSGSSSSSGGSRGGGAGTVGSSSSRSSSIQPSFGNSRKVYSGGAASAFPAGSSSPTRRIAPFVLGGVALAFFPGVWLYGAYVYPYTHPYSFINRTNTTANPSGTNQTLPVTCLCAQYSACGCDESDDLSYLDTLVGNGSFAGLNSSLINVANVNNTRTLILNGTLPNGTDSASSSAIRSHQKVVEAGGFWVAAAMVGAMLWAL